MKKYLFLAALAVLAMACNKEQATVNGAADGQEVSVTLAAELPGVQTKAFANGTTATNLTVEVYESDADGKPAAHIGALHKEAVFTALHTTVTFQLVKGKTYHFIFWSQAENAPYTFDAENKEVTINYAGKANDETRDAFYATKTLKVVGPATETIELHRPFAQVNFGTTAADLEAAKASLVIPTESRFTATDAATVIDLFAGEGKKPTEISYTEAALPTEKLILKDGVTSYEYLAMNYFIPTGKLAESHVSNLTATFKSAKDEVVIAVPNAPVQANWRTNIVGDLLTEQLIFNVEVDPIFAGEEVIDLDEISTPSALAALFANGASGRLTEDVTIDGALNVAENSSVVLDLGTSTINNEVDLWTDTNVAMINVTEGSTLTIKGDGELKAKKDDSYAINVEGGKLVIEGGKINGNISAIQIHYGEVEILGGYFCIQQLAGGADGYRYLLNCIDKNYKDGTAKFIVKGGKFENFNPADCAAEVAHTNFVAPGYKSVQIGTDPVIYEVIPE